MPASHPLKRPNVYTDPVTPDLLRRGEWWCHVAPATNWIQATGQLGPFVLNLEGLPKEGPNRYWCSITAMI